ncbi:MAG: serine hydrolase [Clostridia bacterium]|nr:serine hydrolase [Clostridia bacterium]
MLQFAKPEEVGVSSKHIQGCLKALETAKLSSHSIVMMRHGKVFFEKYWAPFHKDYPHRQYSITKSFVSLAIGFLEQEGKLCLDDKIVDLFPVDITAGTHEKIKQQTVREMLTMETGFPMGHGYWFSHHNGNRLRDYFDCAEGEAHIAGTLFDYDSFGSFVLGALVEHISGESLEQFLRVRLFDKIGVSDKAHFLLCPGGNAWGDSALMCTARDLLKTAQFTMNGGRWNGEQILNEDYVRTATSKVVSNDTTIAVSSYSTYGYGYQFWRLPYNGWYFNGMGAQLAMCYPEQDIIVVYNGDVQGNTSGKTQVLDNVLHYIVENAEDEALPANAEAEKALTEYADSLVLHVCDGEKTTAFAQKIEGKTFVMNKNSMGITWLRLSFNGDEGVLEYNNAQGDKALPFGFGKNVFGKFPQEGYSDEIGGIPAPGNYYDCAVSCGWVEEQKLHLDVQIIDKYLARLSIEISFKDETTVCVRMRRFAEAFLNEYQGYGEGHAE